MKLKCPSQTVFSGIGVPTRLGSLETWTSVSTGTFHACGIAGGALYCWGQDSFGQVGNGASTSTNVLTPVQIGSSTAWTAIAAGQYHTCGINGGQLLCWGRDNHGQQGNGAGSSVNVDAPAISDASTN